jgi:hypothetical protein
MTGASAPPPAQCQRHLDRKQPAMMTTDVRPPRSSGAQIPGRQGPFARTVARALVTGAPAAAVVVLGVVRAVRAGTQLGRW